MAGFINDVIVGTNVNFTGSTETATVTTDGQLLIGSTAAPNIGVSTLTAGSGITITNGSSSITIATSGGGLTWNEVTGTSQTAEVNNGYICNNAALVDITLPVTAAVGDIVRITGKGAGGFRVSQNAGQTIHFGSSDTTTGVGGRLDSTDPQDTVELLCITANTDFNVLSSIGNLTIT